MDFHLFYKFFPVSEQSISGRYFNFLSERYIFKEQLYGRETWGKSCLGDIIERILIVICRTFACVIAIIPLSLDLLWACKTIIYKVPNEMGYAGLTDRMLTTLTTLIKIFVLPAGFLPATSKQVKHYLEERAREAKFHEKCRKIREAYLVKVETLACLENILESFQITPIDTPEAAVQVDYNKPRMQLLARGWDAHEPLGRIQEKIFYASPFSVCLLNSGPRPKGIWPEKISETSNKWNFAIACRLIFAGAIFNPEAIDQALSWATRAFTVVHIRGPLFRDPQFIALVEEIALAGSLIDTDTNLLKAVQQLFVLWFDSKQDRRCPHTTLLELAIKKAYFSLVYFSNHKQILLEVCAAASKAQGKVLLTKFTEASAVEVPDVVAEIVAGYSPIFVAPSVAAPSVEQIKGWLLRCSPSR